LPKKAENFLEIAFYNKKSKVIEQTAWIIEIEK